MVQWGGRWGLLNFLLLLSPSAHLMRNGDVDASVPVDLGAALRLGVYENSEGEHQLLAESGGCAGPCFWAFCVQDGCNCADMPLVHLCLRYPPQELGAADFSNIFTFTLL